MGLMFPGQRLLWQLFRNKMTTSYAYRLIIVAMLMTLIYMMSDSHHSGVLDTTSNSRGKIISAISAGYDGHNGQPGVDQDGINVIQHQPSAAERAVKHNDRGLVPLENVTKPKLLVIVSSAPRSGSSFLGDLLSSQRGTLYLYEPLWFVQRFGSRKTPKEHIDPKMHKLMAETLYKLLRCRTSELPDMFDSRLALTIWKKPLMRVPLTVKQRMAICNDLKLRVAKVIRSKLSNVLPLLQTPEQDVYIVNLVRDPRGVVNSASDLGGWGRFLTPARVCILLRNDIEASLDHTDHPRFRRVRYEDIVAHPEEESRKIFNWMGLELTPEVRLFIDQHSRQKIKAHGIGAAVTGNSTSGTNSTGQPEDILKNAKNESAALNSTVSGVGKDLQGNTSTSLHRTSAEERDQSVSKAIPPEVFTSRFGTIRDASFDGLHWLKELNATKRKETEFVCRDVLSYLQYPLVYPQEEILDVNRTSTPAHEV